MILLLSLLCCALVVFIIYAIVTGFDIVEFFQRISSVFSRNRSSCNTPEFKFKIISENVIRPSTSERISTFSFRNSPEISTSALNSHERKSVFASSFAKTRAENVSNNVDAKKGFPFKSPLLKKSKNTSPFQYKVIN
jgi:hypothetical protein